MNHFLIAIKKEIRNYTFDYLILLTAGIISLIFLQLLEGYKTFSFLILTVFVLFYILWGIYHHQETKTLHLKNIIEYILIGFTMLFILKILFAI